MMKNRNCGYWLQQRMEDGPIALRDLRYFTLAAQMQHISRAAAAPGVSKPFLTKIIRQLENVLGAPLFDHTGRGMTLSPCGKLVYEKSQTILALVDGLSAGNDTCVSKSVPGPHAHRPVLYARRDP